MTKMTNNPIPDTALARSEAVKLSTPLIQQIPALVKTPEQYQDASLIRAKLMDTQKVITERLDKIIKPSYQALQSLYDLKNELINPVKEATARLTESMRQFKLAEAREIQEKEEARRREEDRLRREAEAKTKAAESAKTPQMQGRMQAQAQQAAAKAQEVAERPVEAPVRAVGSTTRKVRRVEVVDFMALVKGVAAGNVPEDVLVADMSKLGDYLKLDAKAVEDMPGIRIVEDLRVVGR